MTLIKSITLKGFKSFAKKTDIPFKSRYSVIIGANGSGKSNICDSLCFVLGKISAKGLRAEKSANLIYNGGKKGSPAKEGEVSIVFDNSKNDFPVKEKEIIVTRTIKQSGNSVYKVNSQLMTRQQVLELLSAAKIDPEGHNIILQGDIVRFTEMRQVERRELIEEIAGISVYEDRKQRALSDLEKVQARLNEANIILTERSAYLKELKKDRDQALRYKELENNILDNKATYVHLQIKDREAKRDGFDKRIAELKKDAGKLQGNIDAITRFVEEKKAEITRLNTEIEEKGENEKVKLHKEIEDIKTDIIRTDSRKGVCSAEIEKIGNRGIQLKKDLDEINAKIAELEKTRQGKARRSETLKQTKSRLESDIAALKKKHGLETDAEVEIGKIENSMDKKLGELNILQEKKQELLMRKGMLSARQESAKEKTKKQQEEEKRFSENQARLDAIKSEYKKLTSDISKKLNEVNAFGSKLSVLRDKLNALNEELAMLKTRRTSQQQDRYDNLAIKRILEVKQGVHGTVSMLGKVDQRYATALSVAAGQRANSVVVDDDAVAAKCIKMLKENKLGVATFLPLNKIKALPLDRSLANREGVVGMAISLVSFEPRYKNIFSYVFGSTLVVENLIVARRIGIGRARMVTLDGDLAEQSGAMIGGYRRVTSSFIDKDADKNIADTESEAARLKSSITADEEKRMAMENEVQGMKEKKAALEVEINFLGESIKAYGLVPLDDGSSISKELEGVVKMIGDIDAETQRLTGEINILKQNRQSLKAKSPELLKRLEGFEKEGHDIELEVVGLGRDIANINVQTKDVHETERNKIISILKANEKDAERFSTELNELIARLKESRQLLKQKEALDRKFYSDFKSLFAKRNKVNELVQKRETAVMRENDKIRYTENRINSISLDRAKIVAEFEGLNKEFEGYVEGRIRRNVALEDLKYEIKKYESLLRDMGNVNLRALEVYEKIGKEYENIIAKVDKLKLEKEDVLKLIREVDDKKASMFMKIFKVLNENFKSIFASLSTKGDAHLEIEDPNNLFESGVNIKVRIATNKFLDIKSLSGGEKTLTALAFIFAIQEFSPASFYFLDEVDAALDKTNSVLLSKLVQKYSSRAQYIVISHNDTIISDADCIYGVSMQDGISKVVSLKV